MDILGQVLATAAITGSLGAAAGFSNALASRVDSTTDSGSPEDLNGTGNDSGEYAVSLAERHESAPAEANSNAEELGFDLNESALPRFTRSATLANGRGRRRKRFKGRGRVMQQNPVDDTPASLVYSQHHGVSTTVVGRRSANSRGNNHKGASLQAALMGALLICAVVWVAKQIGIYRRAAANLSVLQKDYQQLLNQVEASREKNEVDKGNSPAEEKGGETAGGGFLDPGVGNHEAEALEDAWNVDLVAELLATQSRLAELERMREEMAKRPPAEPENAEKAEEEPEPASLPPLTPEEALQEANKLEGELKRLKQQRADLEVVVKLREAIEREQTLVDKDSAAVTSTGNSLSGTNILYRDLLALQEAFSRLGDKEMLAQVEQQKENLRKVLNGAKKSCAWAPGLAELELLVEKERLQTETAKAKAKIEGYHKRKHGGIPGISAATNFVVSSLHTSGQLVWKAVGWIRGGQSTEDTEESLDATQRAERDNAQKENQRLQWEQTLAALKKELADAEARRFAEQHLLDEIHSYDGQQFLAWVTQKYAQASTATDFVLAMLRSLPRSLPSDGQTMTDAQMVYSAALESIMSNALNALEHVEQ